jgi:hypothetical protein
MLKDLLSGKSNINDLLRFCIFFVSAFSLDVYHIFIVC